MAQHFTPLLSLPPAPIASAPSCVIPNPKMDLLAFLIPGGEVVIRRTMGGGKLLTLLPPENVVGSPVTAQFDPSGREIAVGYENRVVIFEMETGSISAQFDGNRVSWIGWVGGQVVNNDAEFVESKGLNFATPATSLSGHFLPTDKYQAENCESSEGSQLTPPTNSSFSLLSIVDGDGFVDFYWRGRWKIGGGVKVFDDKRDNSKIFGCSDGNILSLFNASSPPNTITLSCTTSPFFRSKSSIDMLSYISDANYNFTVMLLSLTVGMNKVRESWKTAIRGVESKIKSLSELFQSYGVVQKGDDGFDVIRGEFLNLIMERTAVSLARGDDTNTTAPLSQFFSNTLTEAALQRLNKTLNGSLATCEDMLRSSCIHACMGLCFVANELVGVARASRVCTGQGLYR